MGKARTWRGWLLVGLLCVGGCAKQDADRLAHIAQKSGQKLDNLTGGVRNKVVGSWHAARGSIGEETLDSRVETRLKWDKLLANRDIQVKTNAQGVVELKGTVADEAQHRRAVELANTTDGVTSVTDSLVVTGS
jgi:osmotically-inducible protein OsmY